MQILLRQHEGNFYVWKAARLTKNGFAVDGIEVSYTDILDANTENVENYVVCDYCGALIKNDPASIEAHYAEQEKQRDCLSCRNKYENNVKNTEVKYTKNDDNTYNAVKTYKAQLSCRNGYFNIASASQQVIRDCCNYYRCRKYGTRELDNLFVNHPHPFETQITVDTLLAKKYNYISHDWGYFKYDLKLRGTLQACVNEMGIIDHFTLSYRNYTYNLYYSSKYDKLYYAYSGCYMERLPHGITTAKWDQVKEKIASLYKEAET